MKDNLKLPEFVRPIQKNTVPADTQKSINSKFDQNNKPMGILGGLGARHDSLHSPEKLNVANSGFATSKKPFLKSAMTPEKSLGYSEIKTGEMNIAELKENLNNYMDYIKNNTGVGNAEIEDSAIEMTKAVEKEIIYRDSEFLKIFSESENTRNPSLNLKVFNSKEELLSHLNEINKNPEISKFRERAVIKFTDDHYISADIKIKKENGENITTVIFSDALGHASDANADTMRGMLEQEKFKGVITSAIFLDTGIQNSYMDCAIFSLSHALKFHKHEEKFDSLHDDLGKGPSDLLNLSKSEKPEYKPFLGPKPLVLKFKGIYKSDDSRAKILTPSFYKHTQSKTKMGEMIENRDWSNEIINKKGETFLNRYDENSMNRLVDGEQKKRNISIEKKRLVFIERSLDYLNSKTKSSPVDYTKDS